MKKYDLVIVGAGLYGCTFARICKDNGLNPLILEQRDTIGGNCYDENIEGINVHIYGAHIFRTSDKKVYEFVSRFTNLLPYSHQVLAKYHHKYYNLPINRFTLEQIYGKDFENKHQKELDKYSNIPIHNLKDKVRNLAGNKIYKILFEGYSMKQWNKPCEDIPADTIRRIQFRDNYNNDYFSEKYEGIPDEGYTEMFYEMTRDIDIQYKFKAGKSYLDKLDCPIIYTGQIDEYYNYILGKLEYRSLKFKLEKHSKYIYQPSAVVNLTGITPRYTRIIEHKHFNQKYQNLPYTYITKEYPDDYDGTNIPFYTVNDEKNTSLYNRYLKLSKKDKNIIFVGRLGTYQYLDMNETIQLAMKDATKFVNKVKKNDK